MLDQVFAWLPLAVLAAMLVVSRVRALAMRRCGVQVVVWQRPWGEFLYDEVLGIVFVFWAYLLVAEAWPLPLDWLPDWLARKQIDALPARIAGAVLMVAAPVLFAAALRSLGQSWRMGVDRRAPGPLITAGLFAWMRNPIYLAFDTAFFGAWLMHGRLVYLLLAVGLALLLHGIVRREEQFLAERFGEAFSAYCQRVGRYSPWF